MRIGVDLGGTKIAAALMGGGTIVRRARVPAPDEYDATLDAIAGLVAGLDAPADAPVGVAMPGAISPDSGTMINARNTPLMERCFDTDLAARLGRPVRVANDANCFALSEAADGAAAGGEIVLGIIIGTGAGAGIVIGGGVVHGAGGTAGEWGHNHLPWTNETEQAPVRCSCGKLGCIETWVSGPALERDHATVTGIELAAEEIDRRAGAGDAGAQATLDRYFDRLARSLAMVINLIDPHVIVLGGGVSNVRGIADAVASRLEPWVFSDRVRAKIVVNVHGDDSGVRGAAWLWPEG